LKALLGSIQKLTMCLHISVLDLGFDMKSLMVGRNTIVVQTRRPVKVGFPGEPVSAEVIAGVLDMDPKI